MRRKSCEKTWCPKILLIDKKITRYMRVSAILMLAIIVSCQNIENGHIAGINHPNIVIVLADDLGYSDIGAYGSEINTPNLDQLAKDGIRFTQMHNTSKCFPSRAVLLTGLYAQQVGMHQKSGDFHNAVLIGEVLKSAGYKTFFVGKHHSTGNPYDWGFDHYRGLRGGAANYFNPGLQREGEVMPAQKTYGKRVFVFDDSIVQPFTPSKEYYATNAWTDWAIDLLEEYQDDDSPYFLYLAYQAPHDPLQAPEEEIVKYNGVYEVGYEEIARKRYERQRADHLLDERYPRSAPLFEAWDMLSDSVRQDEIRRMQVYAAMIDIMDQNIGRVINYIKSTGEWENTLFVFASDNGASAQQVEIGDGVVGSMDRWSSLRGNWANVSNTPYRKFKNYAYEGGTATPFIFHWPTVVKEGGRIDHTPLHFIDIMPTLVDITGARYPETYKGEKVYPMQGESMMPLIRGELFSRQSPIYFNWRNGGALRNEDWKLVREGKKWELYDMRTDRTETNDLSASHPEILQSLRTKWSNWADKMNINME